MVSRGFLVVKEANPPVQAYLITHGARENRQKTKNARQLADVPCFLAHSVGPFRWIPWSVLQPFPHVAPRLLIPGTGTRSSPGRTRHFNWGVFFSTSLAEWMAQKKSKLYIYH